MLDHHDVGNFAKDRLSQHFTETQAHEIAFVISEVVRRMNIETEAALSSMENRLRRARGRDPRE